MLTIKHDKKDKVDVIILEGILNADTSPQLETLLNPISNSSKPCILMHVPDLTYISSAGIGCFIGVIRKIRLQNGDIRFSEMNPIVKRVFKLLDMDDFFQFHSDLELGINSFDE